MDCARANRADFSLIGVWEGAPEVDQELLRRKIEAGEVDPEKLAADCPSGAITWDKDEERTQNRRHKMQEIDALHKSRLPCDKTR